MIDFNGRVAIVTGGSRGIGAAVARLFGRLGARVAVHYRRDEAAARDVVEAIGRQRAAAFAADLSEWTGGEALVRAVVERFGPPDQVVINHGVWQRAPIAEMTEAQYDATLDTNLRGDFAVTGAAVRAMRAAPRTGRSLVLVSSTAGQRGEADHGHYAAAKGAVQSLTKSLAAELASDGIRVNCVAPGWVETDMTRGALTDPASRDRIFASIPLGRVGRPDEIAHAIAFVASEAASFVHGEILNVNGGAVLCG
jgi:3-oxoacyl-[acyl-carrier protein] reductase